jgi:hypothetical protein
MGRYVELAKGTLRGLGQSEMAVDQSKHDPYAVRMQAALSRINRTDYPAGMVVWLEQAAPDLYAELMSRIPDEIDKLWNNGAPLEEFETVLDRLIRIHQEGCRLYREEMARNKNSASFDLGVGPDAQ